MRVSFCSVLLPQILVCLISAMQNIGLARLRVKSTLPKNQLWGTVQELSGGLLLLFSRTFAFLLQLLHFGSAAVYMMAFDCAFQRRARTHEWRVLEISSLDHLVIIRLHDIHSAHVPIQRNSSSVRDHKCIHKSHVRYGSGPCGVTSSGGRAVVWQSEDCRFNLHHGPAKVSSSKTPNPLFGPTPDWYLAWQPGAVAV